MNYYQRKVLLGSFLILLYCGSWLAVVGGVIYIALHFVLKFW